ncbi:hypothetical protein L1987_50460 [Smallanthus sonchifolius]|uniref:Uncharacterized protein n=1 Tax=Smallanthus sonchifolius TaxID=185202 RepID=A0ACB9EN52_9ASTR|nr:hypothetical protein L1987_50460 [Smallanthus sonchifolius]
MRCAADEEEEQVIASHSQIYSSPVQYAKNQTACLVLEIHEGLEFSSDDEGGYSFGIFSVKFSNDGRELVAGSSDDSIYVYDIEANKLSLRIQAHTSDVNSVCFADEASHLIYSGSDYNLCKDGNINAFLERDGNIGIKNLEFLGLGQTLLEIKRKASWNPDGASRRNYISRQP